MTAIRSRGRSFPFVELDKQSYYADDNQGVSKKLTICNHSNPPFQGDRSPHEMGADRLPLVQRRCYLSIPRRFLSIFAFLHACPRKLTFPGALISP